MFQLNYVHCIEKKKTYLTLATQGIYSISSLASKEKENSDLDLISNVIFEMVSSYFEKKSSKSHQPEFHDKAMNIQAINGLLASPAPTFPS